MTAFRSAGNMVGGSESLNLPELGGVSGPGLLSGTEGLAADLADE